MRAKPDPWSPAARVTAVEAEKRTSVEGNQTSEQGVIGVTQRSLENRPRPPRTEGAVDRGRRGPRLPGTEQSFPSCCVQCPVLLRPSLGRGCSQRLAGLAWAGSLS